MPGPFTSYVPPGVYTRTLFEPAINTLIDSVRLPVFVGIGAETLLREDYEMIRGSSAVADNLITKEDVNQRWVTDFSNPQSPVLGPNDGTLSQFQVQHYPIVTGDGSGTTTTDPNDVLVFVDDDEVEVASINGTLGVVTLRNIPEQNTDVRCTYYFNRKDTQMTDDVSDQADGSNVTFKVFNVPIVDGTNGGITSTDPNDVSVTVDGSTATVTAVDGSAGDVTLATAPDSGATVLITYYFNTWQNTFDYLPDTGITEVVRVGLAPGDSSYIQDTDFVVKDDLIHWGTSYRITSEIHTAGSEYFDDTQISVTLVDTKVYLDETSAYTDPDTSVVSDTIFRLTYQPTTGNGRDTTLGQDTFNAIANGRLDLVTDRPELVTAYVGQDVVDAFARSPVTVTKVDGANRLITLQTAVQPNETVFATYWTNFTQDDTYTLEVKTAGASGTGTYEVTSDVTNDNLYEAKFISKTAISQTLNWGTGNQQLLGIFHDGSGFPVEEYVQITINDLGPNPATLRTSIEGPWTIVPGLNDGMRVNGTSLILTPSTRAVVTSSNSETYDLDGLTFYLRSNRATSLTECVFVGNNLTAQDVADQINAWLTSGGTTGTTGVIPGSDDGVVATAVGGFVVLTSVDYGSSAEIVFGSGTGDVELGFTSGQTTTGSDTTPAQVASDLDTALNPQILASVDGNDVVMETAATGLSATIQIQAVANDAYATLGFEEGQWDGGEDAYSAFAVTSYMDDAFTIPHPEGTGSGTVNTGVVGQTYIDEVTGLRFSLLVPEDGQNYDDGGRIRFSVLKEFVTDSANPVYSFLGTEVKVANTTGITVGDTAEVETFDKAGNEPAVGDTYYITYYYAKTDYSAKVFTSLKDIRAEYGEISVQNKLTLGMWLAIQNGALLVAGKQVPTSSPDASVQDYIAAIDSLRIPIDRVFRPAVIVPLTTEPQVIAFTRTHCIVQSSPRYRQERICFFGFERGTTPVEAQAEARSYESNRMIAVYPDSAIISLTDQYGVETEHIVDGSFLAAAVAGSNVSPAYDVASPMTFRQIVGFKRLIREMDEVEKNQTAVAGITVIEDLDPNLRIRQAFTTDMRSSLSREPTVTTIADHVQQTVRSALTQFIGVKFLTGVLGDIERVVKSTMTSLIQAEIITSFTGVKATPDETDPTAVQVELAYVPVFPLNYIVVTFSLRSR